MIEKLNRRQLKKRAVGRKARLLRSEYNSWLSRLQCQPAATNDPDYNARRENEVGELEEFLFLVQQAEKVARRWAGKTDDSLRG